MPFWSKLVNVVRPQRLDEDIAEEIADHLARRAEALRAAGVPAAEADRRAAAAFGNATSIRDKGRDIRTWTIADDFLRDLRHSLRELRRNPAFAATAIIPLGLTIGAVTAVSAIVDAAIVRPLPVPRPDRLFTLAATEMTSATAAPVERTTFSVPAYRDFRGALEGTSSIALLSPPGRAEIQLSSEPSSLTELGVVQFVSENAFEVLRVAAAAGVTTLAPGDASAAILSWDAWTRRFGGDPAIVNRMIRIDGRPLQVIGVAARGFFGVEPGRFVDVWRPISAFDPGASTNRTFHWASVIGRLGGSATIDTVRGRLHSAYAADLAMRMNPGGAASGGGELRVVPLPNGVADARRMLIRPLTVLLAIGLLAALIAAANVASLLLARASARSTEMAVRTSLGAGRSRLMRQLATENVVLAAISGGAGWLVASMALPALAAQLAAGREPVRLAAAMDARVLIACALVTGICAVVLGLLPAYATATNPKLVNLRDAVPVVPRTRFSRAFIAVQVAFAFCLVDTGLAFSFSLKSLFAIDTGFDAGGVTVMSIGADRALPLPLVHELQARVGAQPGVESAAVAWWALFDGNRRMDRVVVPGRPPAEREEVFSRVSPNYFRTLRTPLLAGRDFTAADTEGAAAIPTVVNVTFARRYLSQPGDFVPRERTDAIIGREFLRAADGARHQVIGVAADSYSGDLRHGPDAIAYFPMKPPRWFTLYVRSSGDLRPIVQAVRREAAAIGSGAHLIETVSLDSLVARTVQRERLLATTSGAFALLGLLLAAIGVFGVLNYAVASRSREIGIRCALGAPPAALVQLVLGHVVRPVAAGVLLGIVATAATVRAASSLLFAVRPIDPSILIATMALFLLAAIAAAALPLRRARAVDAARVLRS